MAVGEWGEAVYYLTESASETAQMPGYDFFSGMVISGEAEIITAAEIAAQNAAETDCEDSP